MSEIEVAPEPKKMYLATLIFVARQIEFNLYFQNAPINELLTQLTGLIHMLEQESKDNLKEIAKTLTAYRTNIRTVRRKQIEELYSEIMSYLMANHLKEVRAKPKYTKKSKLTVPQT